MLSSLIENKKDMYNSSLSVELPPPKMESHNNKVLTLDNNLEKPDNPEKKITLDSDGRLSIEVRD